MSKIHKENKKKIYLKNKLDLRYKKKPVHRPYLDLDKQNGISPQQSRLLSFIFQKKKKASVKNYSKSVKNSRAIQ